MSEPVWDLVVVGAGYLLRRTGQSALVLLGVFGSGCEGDGACGVTWLGPDCSAPPDA